MAEQPKPVSPIEALMTAVDALNQSMLALKDAMNHHQEQHELLKQRVDYLEKTKLDIEP